MKNKKHHILTILLIIFMIFMAVSTSQKPPEEIKNSISYETHDEYFLIKIKTKLNPKNYDLFGNHMRNSSFELLFSNQEERQRFSIDDKGNIISELYNFDNKWVLSEQNILSENDFSTFTKNEYFIIQIKKYILKYENPKLTHIYLTNKNYEYIHEIYME